MLRGRTGRGSEEQSERGANPGTAAVAVPISLSSVVTPCADSFHRLLMPCVDSFSKSETDGPVRACPFRSVLSMFMANRMEFSPASTNRRGHLCKVMLCWEQINAHLSVLCVNVITGQTEINNPDRFKQFWEG